MKQHYNFAAVLLLALASPLQGAVMLQPVSDGTDMGATFSPTLTIDQSGLSVPYTNLSTDFDAYVAAQPTAQAGQTSVWTSSQNIRSGNFDLSLGGTYLISAIAFWNLGAGDPSSIQQFSITTSNNSSFTGGTTFAGYTASNGVGNSLQASVQVFGFAPVSASYLRLSVLSTYSGSSYGTGFNEIAVRVVPEPSTMYFLTSGALVILFVNLPRRKRA